MFMVIRKHVPFLPWRSVIRTITEGVLHCHYWIT